MRRVRLIIAGAGVPIVMLTGIAGGALAGTALAGAATPTASEHLTSASHFSWLAGPRGLKAPAGLAAATVRVATRQHYGPPGNASGYSVILVTGAHRAWALGGTNPGGVSQPVAVQWNGRTATAATLPRGLKGFLTDASALSRRNIWAVSAYGRYALHWNGRAWHLARDWHRGPITGLTATSSRDVWVFGTTAAGVTGTGTWHYDGHAWSRVTGRAADIYRGSAVSRRDIWAIAANGRQSIIRYNGHHWHPVAAGPDLAHASLRDILALSDRDVWVLGTQSAAAGGHLLLAHWNGTSWSAFPTRLTAWPGRLVRGQHGTVLVTATPASATASALILQASASGWGPSVTVSSPLGSGVGDVAAIRGSRSLWAVGGMLTRLGSDAVIWHAAFARQADGDADDA